MHLPIDERRRFLAHMHMFLPEASTHTHRHRHIGYLLGKFKLNFFAVFERRAGPGMVKCGVQKHLAKLF
jgi:hypothetical protein